MANQNKSKLGLNKFNKSGLLSFMLVFGAIGSIAVLKSKAATLPPSYSQSQCSVQEWNDSQGLPHYFSDYWYPVSITSSKNLSNMNPGDKAEITIAACDAGSAFASNTGPNPIRLGTVGPRDHNSQLYTSGNWITPYRAATFDAVYDFSAKTWITSNADWSPGQIARFKFKITAPSSPGTYAEHFQMVQENLKWFKDYRAQNFDPTWAPGAFSSQDYYDSNDVGLFVVVN
jgi:hypothetical protein